MKTKEMALDNQDKCCITRWYLNLCNMGNLNSKYDGLEN